MSEHQDIYQRITNLIISRMQAGVVPWKVPWKSDSIPRNGISNRVYSGINHFLLLSLQHESPYYYSFQQVKTRGGNIKKGEKSAPVVFWKHLESEQKDGTIKKTPFIKYYNVFNLSQCEGIDPAKLPLSDPPNPYFDPIGKVEQLIQEWEDCPVIKLNQTHAYYNPSQDIVGIPNAVSFYKSEYYYSVLAHELVHSTGNIKRLGRHAKMRDLSFGSQHSYSAEELVAEMGAAYICGMCGIEQETLPNSTAYIQSWIRTFKNDPKILVIAAAQAQKAVNYILNSPNAEVFAEEKELILEPFEV